MKVQIRKDIKDVNNITFNNINTKFLFIRKIFILRLERKLELKMIDTL